MPCADGSVNEGDADVVIVDDEGPEADEVEREDGPASPAGSITWPARRTSGRRSWPHSR